MVQSNDKSATSVTDMPRSKARTRLKVLKLEILHCFFLTKPGSTKEILHIFQCCRFFIIDIHALVNYSLACKQVRRRKIESKSLNKKLKVKLCLFWKQFLVCFRGHDTGTDIVDSPYFNSLKIWLLFYALLQACEKCNSNARSANHQVNFSPAQFTRSLCGQGTICCL